MKILKRLIILQFLLFLIPISFAEISITLPEKDVYNIGEKIVPTVSIKEDQGYNGFFNLRIICDNSNIQYFTVPLSLEADVRAQVTVPELTLFETMLGSCSIIANFDGSDGKKINNAFSDDFLVTSKTNINTDGDLQAKPGESVLIEANIIKGSGEALSKGIAEIDFMGEGYDIEIVSGKLEHTLKLSSDTEAGNYTIKIVVKDEHGNFGEKNLNLNVIQIPTRIENQIEYDVLLPGENLKAKIILYDHKSNIIQDIDINVKLFGLDENLIVEKEIKSATDFEFDIENSQEPGTYFLLSAYEDIKQQSTFTVANVKKILMKQENNLVHIENVGNVDYDDETTIILESDDKTYLVNKKINLKPQETTTIDLSKEVPEGTYDITLPADAAESENVIESVQIDDERSIVKKTADGLSSITGTAIATAKIIASRPLLASIILITIILGIITYYSKGFIKSKIKGKKPENTEDLFKDFNYEEK